MPRYIDAEKIEQFLRTQMDMQDLYLPIHFVEAIEDMPTADVQEVTHSRWRWSGYDGWNDYYTCLNCGAVTSNDTNFCPRCGARMDGVE